MLFRSLCRRHGLWFLNQFLQKAGRKTVSGHGGQALEHLMAKTSATTPTTCLQPISRNQREKDMRFSAAGAAPELLDAGLDAVLMVMLCSLHNRLGQLTSSSFLVARNCRAARTPVTANRMTETAEANPKSEPERPKAIR